MIVLKPKAGQNNQAFVQSSVKKLKKIMMKDKQLKTVFRKQYFIKKSKLKHDRNSKRKHIRQKFGVQI